MNIFLKLRPYQLFLFMVLAPLCLLLFIYSICHQSLGITYNYGFPVMMFCETGIFIIWFYSIGKLAIQRGSAASKFRLPAFKFYLFFPISYFLLLAIIIGSSLLKLFFADPIYLVILEIAYHIVTPILITAFLVTLYSMYYIGLSLHTAIHNEIPTSIQSIMPIIISIWLFPLGIWYLQKKVNMLYAKHTKQMA